MQEYKKQHCETSSGYICHTVGSHSDDRCGDNPSPPDHPKRPRGSKLPISVVGILAVSLTLGVFAQAQTEKKEAIPPSAPALVTPAEYLKTLAKPQFREGHTLPPLTRFGWTLDFDTRVEFAQNWGYALEWGGYADEQSVERALNDPSDIAAKCMALAAKDPRKYQLAVICSHELPRNDAVPVEAWTRNAEGKFLNGQAKSMDGTQWKEGMDTVYSPEAPDSVWEEAGRLRADPIRKIRAVCPIAIVINSGEYGLSVPGFARKIWEQDPAIIKAKGQRSWFEYISQAKAREELIIANAIRKVTPDRLLYVCRGADGGSNRNHQADWMEWGPGYQWMKPVSDLANDEHYYRHFNCGWTGGEDMLTQVLNAKGFEIVQGQPLGYSWLSAGWPRDTGGLGSGAPDPLKDGGLGDLTRYTGFLKCLYTAGMLGGRATYCDFPPGGFAAKFDPANPPHWLRQMTATGQVHALFSFLDNYLRQGDLLPGPSKHAWSKDQPAYEFPTGSANTHVLARKLRDKPQWLITAWAADGKARPVKVAIPELGEVTLEARAIGSVYEASLNDGKQELKQVD